MSGTRGRRLQRAYAGIRAECSIATACDAKHSPFLLNAIASLNAHFPDRPRLTIYDLGLAPLQRAELLRIRNVEVRSIPAFVPHWRLNWSWKLYVLTADACRHQLYLDLPNLVVKRSLAPWFVAICERGYLVIGNGQVLGDVTPTDYWGLYGLDAQALRTAPTFGAGIIGFTRPSKAFEAIEHAMERTKQGLNLGRSKAEKNPNYRPNIERDCVCFRADQTLLNLSFRQVLGPELEVRRPLRYCGYGGPQDHSAQFVWYARRSQASLGFLFSPPEAMSVAYVVNRVGWFIRLNTYRAAKYAYHRAQAAYAVIQKLSGR